MILVIRNLCVVLTLGCAVSVFVSATAFSKCISFLADEKDVTLESEGKESGE